MNLKREGGWDKDLGGVVGFYICMYIFRHLKSSMYEYSYVDLEK